MSEETRSPNFSEVLLEKWSRTRGPLFEDPAGAICRILAVCEVSDVCRNAPDRAVRIRAARILDEALQPLPDSNRPATKEQHARVSMGLVDVARVVREGPDDGNLVKALARILASSSEKPSELDLAGMVRYFALAELLAAAVDEDSWEISLRAARTLIARTRDAARRVGREQADSDEGDDYPEGESASQGPPEITGNAGPSPSRQRYECAGTRSGAGPP